MGDLSTTLDPAGNYNYGAPGYGDNFVSPSQQYEDTVVSPQPKPPYEGPAPWGRTLHAASTTVAPGDPNAPPATPGTAATGAPGAFEPSITLGPDGNVYGYNRAYVVDPNTGKTSYTYEYANFGAASDLAAVSKASGIPTGMLQQMISQGQEQNKQTQISLAQQQYLSGTAPNGQNYYDMMNANQGNSALRDYGQNAALMQQVPGMPPGTTYYDLMNANQGSGAVKEFAQNNIWNAQVPGQAPGVTYAGLQAQQQANDAAFSAGQSLVAPGLSNQQAGQQASQYGTQQQVAFGQHYNDASNVPGQTWGQLGLTNDANKAMQDYAYGQNYNAASGVPGMTQGQLGLAAGNLSNQVGYNSNSYLLGSSPYTGGDTRQQYEQGTRDITDVNDRSQAQFQNTNLGLSQGAQLADWQKTNNLTGKTQDITYSGGGNFSGTDFYGNHTTQGANSLLSSGSATAGQLQQAQQDWIRQQHQFGMMQRASQSNYLAGYDPNSLRSTIAGT